MRGIIKSVFCSAKEFNLRCYFKESSVKFALKKAINFISLGEHIEIRSKYKHCDYLELPKI